MPFQPEVGQELVIDHVTYRVAEHPAAPGLPYGQEGRQAIVYQLAAQDGAAQALKVFKPRYRLPALVGQADRISSLAELPGLQVCQRTVLTPQRHAVLLRQNPDLTYAVLMPWVAGPTWMEVLLQRQALAPEQSLALARSLAEILATMEQNDLAHCDLSGPNVLLPILTSGAAEHSAIRHSPFAVELVDVEQLYGPDLRRPELLPGGSPGYAHKTAPDGLWGSTADRFAGAVLLGEMLGWCDVRMQEASWGENYFGPQEMQREGERFQTLVEVLGQRWGTGVAGLFERAWRSEVLADCATFGEWLVMLPEKVPVPISPRPPVDEGPEEKAKTDEDTLKMLMDLARRLEGQGNVAGAVEVYRQAQALAPAGSGLAEELAYIVQILEGKQREATIPEPPSLPEEVLVAAEEAATISPEPPLEEVAEAEPTAPVPGAALEEELALIAQGVRAKPPEEAPALELQPSAVEVGAEVTAPPAGEKTDLDQLFDDGLAAYERGEWAKAKELLGEVTRRQAGYARGGYEAWALLAEAERRLAPPRRKRVPVRTRALAGGLVLVLLALGGLVLIISSAIYLNYQAERRAIVEVMKATVLAQYQATVTVQAQATAVAAAARIEVTSTPRSTAIPKPTSVSLATSTPTRAVVMVPSILRLNSGPGDISTLDPARAVDSSSVQVVDELTVGLTRLNEETSALEPGIAENWNAISPDGRRYVFHLRQGIPWVRWNGNAVEEVLDCSGNVRYVTAYDFEYGIKRTLNPDTASDYAYVLNSAIASVEDVKVVDAYTLEMIFTTPAVYNLNIIGLGMAHAQPRWIIEGDDCTEARGGRWTEPDFNQSYGPYVLKEWIHDSSLILVKNPFWWGIESAPVAQIDEIQFSMLDASPAFAEYEAGNLDSVGVPLADLDRVKSDPVLSQELTIAPIGCTYYYGFNTSKPPVDNVHMRRALSHAVDRYGLIDNVVRGGQEPAQWFCAPGMVACPTMKIYPNLGIKYDPEAAKVELEAYMDEMGYTRVGQIPKITLMYNTSEGHKKIAEAIAVMWRETLGVQVTTSNQEWQVYLQTIQEDSPQVWRLGWCLDYPDANNWTREVFAIGGREENATQWRNETFTALLEEGAVEPDPVKRQDMYAQAEQILCYEDAAIIPIYWYTSVSVTKPYISRTYSQIGVERFEKWAVQVH